MIYRTYIDIFRDNFNPTLVQLECNILQPRITLFQDFNPTLVQLE